MIANRRSTDFQGWQSAEEFAAAEREAEERDKRLCDQILKQINARRRLKAMESVKQYARVGLWLFERGLIGIVAIGLAWFLWQVVDAIPRFIRNWH